MSPTIDSYKTLYGLPSQKHRALEGLQLQSESSTTNEQMVEALLAAREYTHVVIMTLSKVDDRVAPLHRIQSYHAPLYSKHPQKRPYYGMWLAFLGDVFKHHIPQTVQLSQRAFEKADAARVPTLKACVEQLRDNPNSSLEVNDDAQADSFDTIQVRYSCVVFGQAYLPLVLSRKPPAMMLCELYAAAHQRKEVTVIGPILDWLRVACLTNSPIARTNGPAAVAADADLLTLQKALVMKDLPNWGATRVPLLSNRVEPRAGSGLPPRTPPTNRRQKGTAPPSTGKAAPERTQPRKSPSSEEGKLEGLSHASDDSNMHMQCTSTPAAVALLEILEEAVEDQRNEVLDDKFNVAAKYVIRARNRLIHRELPKDIGTNERFFTGAMASALNAVLKDGYCVVHQACLGAGATHSDLSATRINANAWPTTLMVGEGKWNASNLREETRGQMFNELLRHRAIDKQSKEVGNNGPILLVAFDQSKVEIDLAFPSTKGGKLETDNVVNFSEHLKPGKETFWTVPILRINIGGSNGRKNLSIVLRFISDSLEKLDSWQGQGRVQNKMPMPLDAQDVITAVARYCGENVTIIEKFKGSTFVYKEYSYHLRQASAVMTPLIVIKEKDKRQPPPKQLLKQLGSPYSEWAVHKGPFGTSVLRYPFIEGSSYTPSVSGWLKILLQIQRMHEIDFVHGDLLPRNVLFDCLGDGYVIDFDLSRKAGDTYVRGYNYVDFKEFRHEEAREGQKMMKDHDLHSLREMSKFFFDLGQSELRALDLDQLISFFGRNPDLSPNVELGEINDGASGSPDRQSY